MKGCVPLAKLNTLRPGVYSNYNVVSDYKKKNVGCAFFCGYTKTLPSSSIPAGQVVKITTLGQLNSYFDPNAGVFYSVCAALLRNGVNSIYAVPASVNGSVPGNDAYFNALKKLADVKASGVIFCDSIEPTVLSEMNRLVTLASSQQKEKIGVVAASNVQNAIDLAHSLNSERMVVFCQGSAITDYLAVYQTMVTLQYVVAVLATASPDQSFHGFTLPEVLSARAVSEDDLERLLAAGVSVLENNDGSVEIVRLVTSRTSTNGVPDRTFSSVNTVLMIDKIIQQVRDKLQSLIRSNNSRFSLDSIASQTALILEDNKQNGFISSFEPPVVFKDDEDPLVCVVEMEFALVSAPSQIFITAHVSL